LEQAQIEDFRWHDLRCCSARKIDPLEGQISVQF